MSRDQKLTGSFELDHPIFLDKFGSLLELVKRRGSEALAALADELSSEKELWKQMLASYWNGQWAEEECFFVRACLQPYLEHLANTGTLPFDSSLMVDAAQRAVFTEAPQPHQTCPFCGRKPQLAFISNETSMPGLIEGSVEGGRRFLMCGDCLTPWPFQRIACASCLEVNPYKLPYYSAADAPTIRVECCESCKHYIKSIDLTKDNRAVPPVDELAAVPLDLWAQGQGYTKTQLNLAGM